MQSEADNRSLLDKINDDALDRYFPFDETSGAIITAINQGCKPVRQLNENELLDLERAVLTNKAMLILLKDEAEVLNTWNKLENREQLETSTYLIVNQEAWSRFVEGVYQILPLKEARRFLFLFALNGNKITFKRKNAVRIAHSNPPFYIEAAKYAVPLIIILLITGYANIVFDWIGLLIGFGAALIARKIRAGQKLKRQKERDELVIKRCFSLRNKNHFGTFSEMQKT